MSTPLPRKQIFILSCITFCEPFSFLVLLPFIYFMVKDFNLTSKENEIGYYVGVINSLFQLACMFSGLVWGYLSDRFGRRPILLVGLFGNAIFSCIFGLCKSYHLALASRIMCGLFSGNSGVAKSVLGEITDSTNEGKGFSIFGIMFSLGSIVGPAVGGFLSNPVEQFPYFFGDSQFLQEYPYFLPCLVTSIISSFVWMISLLMLDETLPAMNQIPQPTSAFNPSEQTPLLPELENNNHSQLNIDCLNQTKTQEIISYSTFFAILPYMTLCFIETLYDGSYALWAIMPAEQGGLSFTASNIGSSLAILGVAGLLIQSTIYSKVQEKFGSVLCYRWSMVAYAISALLLPTMSGFAVRVIRHNFPNAMFWLMLLSILSLRMMGDTFAYTSVMLFVCNAGRQAQAIGTVNGISQCCAAFIRSLGPAIGGIIWSWSLEQGYPFPLDYHCVFVLIAILSLFSFHLSYWVNKYVI